MLGVNYQESIAQYFCGFDLRCGEGAYGFLLTELVTPFCFSSVGTFSWPSRSFLILGSLNVLLLRVMNVSMGVLTCYTHTHTQTYRQTHARTGNAHTHTHALTHAPTHSRTHARTHARTHYLVFRYTVLHPSFDQTSSASITPSSSPTKLYIITGLIQYFNALR